MTDETYLKMVLALPDKFFEGWEWQAGDRFIRNYSGEPTIYFIGDSVLGRYNSNEPFVPGFTYGEEEFCAYEEDVRPLPTQEQLQEMVKKLWESKAKRKVSNYELLKVFYYFVGDSFEGIDDGKCFECMWLEYLVMNKSDKIWHDEEWV